jgi:hypothetical protein
LKGAGSYLGAIVATQAFDKEVQDICRDAYTRNAPALISQMGLDSAEPEPYKYDEDAGEHGVELGMSRPAQKGGCCFYIYLQWLPAEGDRPEVKAVIWLDLKGRRSRDELYARLRAKSRACKVAAEEGAFWGLELASSLPPERLADASAILDKLVSEWCAYCKSIGGLKLNRT